MKKVLVTMLLVALVASVASAELRAWYKLDETSGKDVWDSSGYMFDAMASSPTWDPDGAIDGCMNATGTWTNNYINVPRAVFTTMDQQATIAWWAQIPEQTGGWFSAKNSSGTNVASAKDYVSGTDHYVPFNIGGSSNDWWWDYDHHASVGEWHHFALVFDATAGKEILYFDGQAVVTADTEAGDSMANIEVFHIGTRSTGAGAWWDSCHGKMDDFRIYDNALTAAEVDALVPEPTTIALLGLGGLALIRRKK